MITASVGFLRSFMRDPRAVGAVAPATRTLAACVAQAAEAACREYAATGAGAAPPPLKVIELGAGTGALTQQLFRLNPVVIEKDEAWARLLRGRFPSLEVRQECASRILRELHEPVGVVSSIPLLNNPQSTLLKELLAARYADGLLRFCVLYTYGWSNPLAAAGFRHAERIHFVPRSLPPAHVWAYR